MFLLLELKHLYTMVSILIQQSLLDISGKELSEHIKANQNRNMSVIRVILYSRMKRNLYVTKGRSTNLSVLQFRCWMEPLMILWSESKKIQSANLSRVAYYVLKSSSSLKDQQSMVFVLQKILQFVFKPIGQGLHTYARAPSSSCTAAERRTATPAPPASSPSRQQKFSLHNQSMILSAPLERFSFLPYLRFYRDYLDVFQCYHSYY